MAVQRLGYAGVLPFIFLAIAIYMLPQPQDLLLDVLATYTFAIICFLAGSWWGLALIRKNSNGLLLSNALVLLTVAASVLLSTQQLLIAEMLILLSVYLLEQIHPLFKPQPAYYRRMRLVLSLVAGSCLMLAALR